MAEMLLINPRRRRKATAKRTTRRRNPVARVMARPARRRNPVAAMKRRVMRRKNPIGMTGYMKPIQEAFIGGAGAIAFDLAQGQLNKFLPATLKTTPGMVGLGDGVKAVMTVLVGRGLSRMTRGLSMKLAQGALTVQSANIMKTLLGTTLGNQLGYASPAFITQGTNRVGPIRNQNVGAYLKPGMTPLLGAYTRPGTTPLLSAARNTPMTARSREGYVFK